METAGHKIWYARFLFSTLALSSLHQLGFSIPAVAKKKKGETMFSYMDYFIVFYSLQKTNSFITYDPYILVTID